MSYASTILATANLSRYWRLAEASGTTATDQTAAANGTYSATGVTYTQGNAMLNDTTGNSAKFDGTTGEVTLPLPSITTDATFEVWLRWVTGSNGIHARDDTSAGAGWIPWRSNAGWETRIAGTTFTAPITWPVDTGGFHYFVTTVTGGVLSNYLDGLPVYTASGAPSTATTSPLHIGRNGNTATFSAVQAQDVAVYTRALSAGEVLSHYNASGRNVPFNNNYQQLRVGDGISVSEKIR